MTSLRPAMLPVLVIGIAAMAAAAETLRLDSAWSPESPTVDGKLTEWSSPLVTLGQTKLSLGARNDGQHLSIALASSDQAAQMMLGAAGFTVWIDPAGQEKKAFGIAVPATMRGPGMRGRGQGAPPEPGQEGREGGPGGQGGPAVAAITSIEVIGPSKDDRRRLELTYARTIGLDVAARVAEGVLVYELRLPLAVSEAQPYGAKSAPGATISLGIETSRPPEPAGGRFGGIGSRGGTSGDPAGGGGGRGGGMGGGGMPGGMGGPPDGGRGEMRDLKPIKAWTTVRLAKAPE